MDLDYVHCYKLLRWDFVIFCRCLSRKPECVHRQPARLYTGVNKYAFGQSREEIANCFFFLQAIIKWLAVVYGLFLVTYYRAVY